MNCAKCSNFLPNDSGRFCSFCGIEKVQQSERQSVSIWGIVSIAAAAIVILALCCAGLLLAFNTFDDSILGTTTDTSNDAASDSVDLRNPPTDDEVVRHLENRYGVNFSILYSFRDEDRPGLELRPLNQADMSFHFIVRLADRDGNCFTLDEIEDGFFLALAEYRAEESIRLLAEDVFGRGAIDRVHVSYRLSGWDLLPQSVYWSPDDGMDFLRHIIAHELSDEIDAYITVAVSDSQDADEILWEQVEELAEKITTAGFYGINNSLSVNIGWEMGGKRIEWRAQDGEMFSVEGLGR